MAGKKNLRNSLNFFLLRSILSKESLDGGQRGERVKVRYTAPTHDRRLNLDLSSLYTEMCALDTCRYVLRAERAESFGNERF